MTSLPKSKPQTMTVAQSARCIAGGVLMGLANLVPGISGGTMLLAVGIYERLIEAIASLASRKWTLQPVLLLGLVVLPAVAAIVAFSGVAERFVLEDRWIAYSVFIGLTLGGVPVLLRTMGRMTIAGALGCVIGLIGMWMLASGDPGAAIEENRSGFIVLLFAGIAAGGSMLLPGVSGSYVLLILGQYVAVLGAVDAARRAAMAGDLGGLVESLWIIAPVGLGAVIGIAVVGVVVRWLLRRAPNVTLGVLLGLLLGALLGLWPFRGPVPPSVGDVVRGVEVTSAEAAAAVKPKYWRLERFDPSSQEITTACVLVLLGASCSSGIGLLGVRKSDSGVDCSEERG